MKCFHRQLLLMLSFNVSIENFGFTVSTPFFLLKKVCFLNTKMSKMHVNHSCVVEDPAKIYSVAALSAKQLFFFCLQKIFFQAG